MLAYDTVYKEEAGAINIMAPFKKIEMHVTSCFKAATNPLDKRKCKKPAGPGPTKQEFN